MLPLLGSTVKSAALPTLTTCPVCRAQDQLLILLDNAIGGEWAYCRACEFAGDMIALAAATWKLGTRLTLRRLSTSDTISSAIASVEAATSYDECYGAQRKGVMEFWHECQAAHIRGETSVLRVLQHRLNACPENQGPEWLQKSGRFIGSSSKKEVDATFSAKKFQSWDDIKNKRSGSFPSDVFRGAKWNELLVIPCWDMPGRICGFIFVGRDVDPAKDFIYKGVLPGIHEGGIAMLHAILQDENKVHGNNKFIFTDVDIAMRFHTRHSRDHMQFLPMAATWDDGRYITERTWSWLGSLNLIFWGTDKLKTILQAMRAGGRVSMLDVPRIELESNMRNYSPIDWLGRMRKQAVPWVSALQKYLAPLSDNAIEEAFLTLGIQGRSLDEFSKDCEPELQEKLKHITSHKSYAAKIKFEKHWIFEKPDGWYMEGTGERISNAIVRIEQVLVTLDNRSYYRGVIKFKDKTYPFTEKAITLDRGMLAWAQVYLRDQMRAGVSEFYPSWNRKSIHLATGFFTPQYAQGVEIIGWDKINRQFNFPKFSICQGGKVTTDFACLFHSENTPARDIPLPGLIPRKHIDTLSDVNDETQIFWAIAACVAANVIAPAVNRNQVSTLLMGDGAQGVGRSAAFLLGCTELVNTNRRELVAFLSTCRRGHAWPMVVNQDYINSLTELWVDHDQTQGFFFTLPSVVSQILAMRGRVNLIRHDRKLGSLQLCYHAAPFVVQNYLQDLYTRNIFLPNERRDLVLDVLDDISVWFGKLGGRFEVT